MCLAFVFCPHCQLIALYIPEFTILKQSFSGGVLSNCQYFADVVMDAAVAFVSVSALVADLFLSDTNHHAVEADDITLFQFMSVHHLESIVGSGEDFVSVHICLPCVCFRWLPFYRLQLTCTIEVFYGQTKAL